MRTRNRYIYILIIAALVGLIGLQVLWLGMVYKYKVQELQDKTREALLETSKRYQKFQDSKIIITNLDSLMLTENIVGSDTNSDIRVIVSKIKNKLNIDTLIGATEVKHQRKMIGDSSVSTTIIKLGGRKEIITKSQSFVTAPIKKKAADLQSLFLKMAVEANVTTTENIQSRIDFKRIQKILKEELENQGIYLFPELAVTFSPKRGQKDHGTQCFVYETGGFVSNEGTPWILVPLFTNDFFSQDLFLAAFFSSSGMHLLKQMAGILSLSLLVSLLIAFVIIYVFRKMLSQEKLHQIKNDFINNMTHELKTPIATISLALDAINNPQVKNDEEKFNNYSRILKEENQKLNVHVERVLQMALLDKGELLLNKKQISLNELLNKAISHYALQIEKRKAQVIFNSEQEVTFIGDGLHLLSVFSNLLDNALKYSNSECRIEISLIKNSDQTIITFKDNGIGIDQDLKEKIFEKFYRVQGGNLHDVKGFGLGLSYVRSVIHAHGGTIEVKSEKNVGLSTGTAARVGSEFIITLPNG